MPSASLGTGGSVLHAIPASEFGRVRRLIGARQYLLPVIGRVDEPRDAKACRHPDARTPVGEIARGDRLLQTSIGGNGGRGEAPGATNSNSSPP